MISAFDIRNNINATPEPETHKKNEMHTMREQFKALVDPQPSTSLTLEQQ